MWSRTMRRLFGHARNVTNTTAVQDAAITTGASATGTIQNDDTARLSISAPTITETDVDHTVSFTATLDKAVEGGFQVRVQPRARDRESNDYTVNTTAH